MIIWRTKITSAEDDRIGRRWRSVLRVRWFGVEWESQVHFHGTELDAWVAILSPAGFEITARWTLGRTHGYYDGPHCRFSLGFVHFMWSSWSCKRCLGEVE